MIAIHSRPESFSDKWIEYCKQNGVPYKIVDCYDSNIIDQVQDCKGLMWHWAHYDYKAQVFARQLTYSLEMMGKKVFPDSQTCWHYDDKVGQKYLLEAIGAPLVPSHVFYDKEQALEWAVSTTYPKVFKLRGGAGSINVKLVESFSTAKKLIKKAFTNGFKSTSRFHLFKDRLWHFKRDKNLQSFFNISRGIGRLIIPTRTEKFLPVEKNYVYFQDYIPNNDHDIRIIVIGKRAFAIKRMIRSDDFRASGSGNILYDQNQIPEICVQLAFKVTKSVNAQSIAYDFIFHDNKPKIVEISYCFSREGYLDCPGYWNKSLEWQPGNFFPEFFMIEDFLKLL